MTGMTKQWLEGYEPVRRQPRMWIETLWLLESREPLSLTRTIDLHPGLNIVWARERARVRSGEDEPVFETILGESIESRVRKTLALAETSEAAWEIDAGRAEQLLTQEQLQLARLNDKVKLAEVEMGIAKSLVEANQVDFERLTKMREKLACLDGRCDHGDVEFSACQHIQARKSTINMTWFRDGKEAQAKALEWARHFTQCQADHARSESAVAAQQKRVLTQQAALRGLRVRVATSESSRSLLKTERCTLPRVLSRGCRGCGTTR